MLPTYSDAALAVLQEEAGWGFVATPLEHFIFEEQPLAVNEEEFRRNLTELVEYYEAKRRIAEYIVATVVTLGGILGMLVTKVFFT